MEKSTRQLGLTRTFAGCHTSTTPAVRVLYKLQRTVGAIYLRFLAALRFGAFLAALRFGAFFLAAFFFAAMVVGISLFRSNERRRPEISYKNFLYVVVIH